jgi:hypothetical protein
MADGGNTGPNLHAMGLLDAKKPTGGNENPTDIFDAFTKLFDQLPKIFSKVVAPITTGLSINFDSLMKTGVFVNADITKAALQVNNPIVRQNMDVNGGMLANLIIEGSQIASAKDFSKISVPQIEGMSYGTAISDISPSVLGTLSPPIFAEVGPARSLGGGEIAMA